MKKIYLIGGIIVLATTIIGGYFWIKRQADLLLDFCYTISSFRFSSINTNGISFSLILNIVNQSDIDINIKGYNFNVYLNDIKLANIISSQSQIWAKRSTSPIAVNINVKWNDLSINIGKITELVRYYITNKSKLLLKIDGKLSAEAFKISIKDYPFDMQFTIAELLSPNTEPSTCKIQ